jgi:hypothetical protein
LFALFTVTRSVAVFADPAVVELTAAESAVKTR